MPGRILQFAAIVIVAVAVVCGISLLLAWPFMWLWNFAVVEAIAVAKPITYWTAVCLMVFMTAFVVGVHSSNS